MEQRFLRKFVQKFMHQRTGSNDNGGIASFKKDVKKMRRFEMVAAQVRADILEEKRRWYSC
jgi:hypothetical protein